ncbi:MAG: hypothetical protein PHP85_12915 [Gallionella sp.]|nr:hypothetical protein [Gallionella sp.]
MVNQKVRFFHRCALAGLAVCLFGGQVRAEEDGSYYGPVFDTKQVKALTPVECQIDTVSGFVLDTNQPTVAHCGTHDITITGVAKTRKRGQDEETTHVVVNLKGKQQKALEAVLRVNDFPAEFIDSVEFFDLNGDGQDDFILNLSGHGNGLAAELGGTLFLLSGTTGYQYLGLAEIIKTTSRYMRLADNNMLVLQRLAKDKNGSSSVRGSDGKSHTFFVFDWLKFDVTAPRGVSLNNQLDVRFPFWTLFTEEPEHAETTRLSSARKKALWRDPLAGVVSGRLVAK